jgi:hypothetical protein
MYPKSTEGMSWNGPAAAHGGADEVWSWYCATARDAMCESVPESKKRELLISNWNRQPPRVPISGTTVSFR